MQTPRKTKQINNVTSTTTETETLLKCGFCGKLKEDSLLLVQGFAECCICDKCIKRAYQMYKNEVGKNDTETDMPILKTARAMAGNREVIINMFEHQYTVTVRRYCQTNSDDGIFETMQTINLTEPSLCLLVRALSNIATDFNINIESIINQLKGDSEIYETFNSFEPSDNIEKPHQRPTNKSL